MCPKVPKHTPKDWMALAGLSSASSSSSSGAVESQALTVDTMFEGLAEYDAVKMKAEYVPASTAVGEILEKHGSFAAEGVVTKKGERKNSTGSGGGH